MQPENDQLEELEEIIPVETSFDAAPDVNPSDRPGVPEEVSPPRPVAHAHWTQPEAQQSNPHPLVGVNIGLKPVYSTAIPPRGLSGLIRRVAYKIPEHRASRWLLLLMADRIDAIEHEPANLAKAAGFAGLIVLGMFAVRAARNR